MKLTTLLSAIANCAQEYPERIAVIADGTQYTYRNLWDLVNTINGELNNLVLPIEAPIAVTAYKSISTLALMLALGSRGHTPLAISPDLGHSVKPALFKNAGVSCELATVLNNGVSIRSTRFNAEPQKNPYDITDTPLMLTTSGSTGIPKVVLLTTKGINAFFDWASSFFELDNESRILSYAPLNFDLSLLEVWTPLALGGTVIFTNINKSTQTSYLRALIRETKPHLIQGVPMLFSLLCREEEILAPLELKAKHIIFTGDVTSKALREKVARFFPEATFHNIYGCTETNDSFVHTSSASNVIEYDRLPLGSPIEGTTYRVIGDSGEVINVAGEGELHTSTPFLAKGYTEPSKTKAVFYHYELEGRTYYNTGDRVTLNKEGVLTLLGRSDYIVKVRGVRTNLQDIEQIISMSELVNSVVVIPVNDDLAGVSIHAVIELKENQKLDGLSLRILCSKYLPLTSVPSRFHVHHGSIPRTSTGKPDRKKVAQLVEEKEI